MPRALLDSSNSQHWNAAAGNANVRRTDAAAWTIVADVVQDALARNTKSYLITQVIKEHCVAGFKYLGREPAVAPSRLSPMSLCTRLLPLQFRNPPCTRHLGDRRCLLFSMRHQALEKNDLREYPFNQRLADLPWGFLILNSSDRWPIGILTAISRMTCWSIHGLSHIHKKFPWTFALIIRR